jgi:hypothetical protein
LFAPRFQEKKRNLLIGKKWYKNWKKIRQKLEKKLEKIGKKLGKNLETKNSKNY